MVQKDMKMQSAVMRRIIDNIEKVFVGKTEKVELAVMCLVAGGHILIEDIPGVGKTSLVSALARSVSCDFKRIQFTPDVMPSDITGFSVFNQKSGEFEFRSGAAMSNIILADEINRAPAKTQSAMLEIMEERQVTVDSKTYSLDRPYMVLATQNPIEALGTYRLPEAQIDRFMIKLSLGYPSPEDEVSFVMNGSAAKSELAAVVSREELLKLMSDAESVHSSNEIAEYIVRIVGATRGAEGVSLGSSPRGSIALFALSKAYALLQGRSYVIPDDVKYLAPFALSHRIILAPEVRGIRRPEDVVRDIVARVKV